MKRICEQCGAELLDDAKYCTNCGKEYKEEKMCPNCNAPIKDGAKFCTRCGMKVDSLVGESAHIIEKNRCKKWYQRTGGIIFWLILFFPIGLYLMWKYAEWKKGVKIAVSVICICSIAGALLNEDEEISSKKIDTQEMAGNVEQGLGQMGARFNMDLETFTRKFNKTLDMDILDFNKWYLDGQTPQEGTDEIFNMYFYDLYDLSDTVLIGAVIESSTGKINTVNILTNYNDGSDEAVQMARSTIICALSVLADIDLEKSNNIFSEVINNNNTGLPTVYENICMRFVNNTTFMITPVSDEILETMQYIEID